MTGEKEQQEITPDELNFTRAQTEKPPHIMPEPQKTSEEENDQAYPRGSFADRALRGDFTVDDSGD